MPYARTVWGILSGPGLTWTHRSEVTGTYIFGILSTGIRYMVSYN
jgi:hypothetical protein